MKPSYGLIKQNNRELINGSSPRSNFFEEIVDRKILYWNVANETLFGESAKLTRDLIWYELFFMISWFFNLPFLGIYNKVSFSY